jgi:hypothetical protein
MEHQRHAERFEREFREAREAGRVEVQRTRILMDAEIEAANNQVNVVRADLEAALARAQNELDTIRMEADTAKEKHELVLEQEADSKREVLREAKERFEGLLEQEAKAKRDALREATEERSRVLYQQRQKHEQILEDMRKQQARELQIVTEDKERLEANLNERLSLADSKVEHLEDKVRHLEERLEVAKSAAQAAVQAAQSAKSPVIAEHAPLVASKSSAPERISPQALRESIAVLQEQLQERETRIEQLQQDLDAVDTEAPNKLKERDIELGWLRELLGVRIDDISDLINTLSRPHFERDAVRDAAIRIRTNLQMEQQEKERLMKRATSGMTGAAQPFPNLTSSISSFASPKAVQLAAALGNWRKGKDAAVSNLSQFANSAPGRRNSSRSSLAPSPSNTTASTPSKPTSGFLSGLMTPPTSNLRRTPPVPSSDGPTRSLAEEMGWDEVTTPRQGPKTADRLPLRRQQQAPSTPPLMRRGSYDQDADGVSVGTDEFGDEYANGSLMDAREGGFEDEVQAQAGRRGSDMFGPGLTTE